jgi:hypothetical protein
MPPRHELNDRFKGHIAKARRTRQLVATSLLVTCLLVGSGLALEMAPPDALAAVKRGITDLTASLSVASFLGFASFGVCWYAEFPITSATRFCARHRHRVTKATERLNLAVCQACGLHYP